jgi:pilus assembly protein Flp/PilA
VSLRRLIIDERGVTSIEYVLIASLIAVVIAVGVGALGGGVKGLFVKVQNAFP